MSYSFSVRGADKAASIKAVSNELDKVVANQSIHAKDRAQALAAAESMVAVLADDPERDVQVDMWGSVSWRGDEQITAASVSVSVALRDREAAAATPPPVDNDHVAEGCEQFADSSATPK